jgi:DNA (cytosine-5)-methyltransferase 1
MKLTVNELFSGIGAQRMALERLGISHRVVGISEIDKYAIKSYETMFGKTKNYGDISMVEKLDYADLWTYSFPCQDLSIAGHIKGMEKGTQSGLLFEVKRLLIRAYKSEKLPKYLLLENVKNLVGKKFKPDFDRWIGFLNRFYNTYWQVLNAKNYGIPQNRERVFAVSIRKDIDNGQFKFPEPFDNGLRLKDFLEDDVDEKYFLPEWIQKRFIKTIAQNSNIVGSTLGDKRNSYGQRDRVYDINKEICTLSSTMYKGPPQITHSNSIKQIGMLDMKGNEQIRRVYSPDGCCPTLNTMQGGNTEPKILQIPRGYNNGGLHEVSPTISSHSWECNNFITENNMRIRKITPRECWRLMGFYDSDFDRAQQFNSNSQLYKQAGNSIVVDVLYYIFKNLFEVV